MAQFNGFRCDSCGKVLDHKERTKKTIRFEGHAANGEYAEDLCSECVAVPAGVELKPLRRRKRTETQTAA